MYKGLGGNENSFGYSLTELLTTSDGGLVVCGSGSTSIETSGTFVLKTSESGDVIWNKYIYTERGSQSIIETSDGGFLLTATMGAAWINWNMRTLLIKLNANGEWEWNRSVWVGGTDFNSSNKGMHTLETPQGNFITVGGSSLTEYGSNDVLLYESASNGNLNWSRKFGSAANETAVKVFQSGTDYIIVGRTFLNGSPLNGMFVTRTNASGVIVWSKIYSATIEYVKDALMVNDTLCVAAKTAQGVILAKIDGQGNLVWGKEYAVETTPFHLQSVSSTQDSGFLLTGYVMTNPRQTFVIRTDAIGDTIWTRSFGQMAGNMGFKTIEMDDTYLLLGTRPVGVNNFYFPYLTYMSDLPSLECSDVSSIGITSVVEWTASVSDASWTEASYGVLTTIDYSMVDTIPTDSILCELIIGLDNETDGPNAFKVYPNPTESSFTIETEHTEGSVLLLLDMAGRQILSVPLQSAKQLIAVDGVSSGCMWQW